MTIKMLGYISREENLTILHLLNSCKFSVMWIYVENICIPDGIMHRKSTIKLKLHIFKSV